MELMEIFEVYNRIKEQIRNKTHFRVPISPVFNGFTMALAYSEVMEYVVKGLFDLTIEELGSESKEGIAAFFYGSPGRREMVCESDLDLLFVYKDDSQKFYEFKEKFKELAEPFKFCKIDLPQWGTVEEAVIFAKRSITEGNQILESRYICGDENIRQNVENIQKEFGNFERMTRNITFQKFYFEQYFKQRVRNGAINVKYCDGGSRDYLFIHWFNQLMSFKYPDWNKAQKERPVAEIGLSNLYQNGLVSSLEFGKAMDSLHFNLLFRNEILLVNKGTSDEGLTFLDEKTLDAVFVRMPELMKGYKIGSPQELAEQFNTQRCHIANIKERVWNLMIEEEARERKNPHWTSDFYAAYFASTPECQREKFISSEDCLIKLATIWGASNSGQIDLLNKICEREKDSDSWEIQASLTTSPYCSPEYLHYIGTGIGKELGYGYILRIISRNPSVQRKTLEAIANDSNLDKRYTQCAVAALEFGGSSANHQI